MDLKFLTVRRLIIFYLRPLYTTINEYRQISFQSLEVTLPTYNGPTGIYPNNRFFRVMKVFFVTEKIIGTYPPQTFENQIISGQ
jgi:hypothetical protein